jgi:hypothetical protein
VLNFTKQFIDECSSESYVIVRQGGISAADLLKSKAAPHLQKLMSNEQLNTKLSITEVVGEVDAEELINYISTKCDALKLHLDPRGLLIPPYATGRCTNRFSGVLDSPLTDEHKSLVLSIEMDSLPIETSERVAQLVENGAWWSLPYEPTFADGYRLPSPIDHRRSPLKIHCYIHDYACIYQCYAQNSILPT